MRKSSRYISLSLLILAMLLCTSCRRTKICECTGTLNGKPETLYFNVEHSFRCKDLNRTGYERQQDTIFIRTMHNISCVEQEYSDILYEEDRESQKNPQQ